MKHMSIGDRIKRYEAAYNFTLTPRSCVFIRVDGRAFHTFTKGLARPFDLTLMNAMVYAAQQTAAEIQGFKLAYVQSDEATFMLTDFDSLQSQGWFGYELNKLVSLSASLFTAHFNDFFDGPTPATFDSRAFVVPLDDAPNVFVWRQKDWTRNSLQMVARAHFSHKECHGKKSADLHEMLHGVGVNWATDFTMREKNGTFIAVDGTFESDVKSYLQIMEYLGTVLPSAAEKVESIRKKEGEVDVPARAG